MKVFSERASDTPLVAISVLAAGGAGLDEEGLEGTAHHIAELAVRGAGPYDRFDVDTELDRIGASLSVNTSRDHIGYTAMCLSRHADRVVELLGEIISHPRFNHDEHAKLVRETRSDLEEIRDDDADLAARYFARFFWPGHPYARAIEGSEASLARLAATHACDLAARYRETLALPNVVLGFAGAIAADDIDRYSKSLTAELTNSQQPSAVQSPSRPSSRGSRVFLIEKPKRSQSQVLIGHPAPHYAAADGPALLLAEAAFGGMFSSRLMQEVRVKRGWSYDAGIRLARSAKASWIRMSMAPSAEVTADAIELVIGLYRQLIESGLEAAELDLARRFTIGGMLLSRATARQRVHQSCVGAVSGLPQSFVPELPKVLEALTLEQVNAAIGRHLTAEGLTIVVVGSRELAESLSAFGEVSVVAYRSY